MMQRHHAGRVGVYSRHAKERVVVGIKPCEVEDFKFTLQNATSRKGN